MGFFKKLVEKITGRKSAPQKKDGRPQQGRQGDAKGKDGNGRGRHGRRGRHGNGGGEQQQRTKQAKDPPDHLKSFLSVKVVPFGIVS